MFVEMIGVEKDGIVEVDYRIPGFLRPPVGSPVFGENGTESSSARSLAIQSGSLVLPYYSSKIRAFGRKLGSFAPPENR